TFSGLAGLGDLMLTCTGSMSRNRALGCEIARGRALGEVQAATRMVAEGVRTVESALRLAAPARGPLAVCAEGGQGPFEGRRPADALRALLARELRSEDEEGRSRA